MKALRYNRLRSKSFLVVRLSSAVASVSHLMSPGYHLEEVRDTSDYSLHAGNKNLNSLAAVYIFKSKNF